MPKWPKLRCLFSWHIIWNKKESWRENAVKKLASGIITSFCYLNKALLNFVKDKHEADFSEAAFRYTNRRKICLQHKKNVIRFSH